MNRTPLDEDRLEAKAEALAQFVRRGQINETTKTPSYVVPSGTDGGLTYTVQTYGWPVGKLHRWGCQCLASRWHPSTPCAHVRAVGLHLMACRSLRRAE